MDEEIRVSSIVLDNETARVPKDMTITLRYTIMPFNATNQEVTWTSSDNTVASVDETGKVRGVHEGIATITVKTVDGNKTDTCEVTVTQPVTHVTVNDELYEHTPSSKQVFYDANNVTCYPGSNQSDNGKLNLEFNMARLITRITSKNFCITRPAFELSRASDLSGHVMVKIEKGQASINGMDLIINQDNKIYPPDEPGDYYLALHLWRDSSSNVLGDLTIGVQKQFKGVYLDWFKVRDEYDDDTLWLGKIHYDGSNITSMEEDQEKYGRVWTRDISTKLNDWKHSSITSMVLQDWVDKVPDWYVSKEGDVIFGTLEFLDGRKNNIPGTYLNHEDLGSDGYGVRINVEDDKSSIVMKQPSASTQDATDSNKLFSLETSVDGVVCNFGNNIIEGNYGASKSNMKILANDTLFIESKDFVRITGRFSLDQARHTTMTVNMAGVYITNGPSQYADSNDSLSVHFDTDGSEEIEIGEHLNINMPRNGNLEVTEDKNMNYTVGTLNGSTYETGTGAVDWRCKTFNISGNLDVGGDITATRVFNAVYNDLAEYMEKADYNEEINYGDIVVFTEDGKVTKPSGSIYDVNRIAGIVSSPETMGLVLGGEGLSKNQKVAVALAGRVYLNTGDLDVQSGDLIALGSDGNIKIVGDYSRAVIGKATKHSAEGKTFVLVK